MILTAICGLAILGVAFAWGSKARGYGFFSALMTLASVLAAGAIAFGLWETVVYKVMFTLAEKGGFLGNMAMDNAWGLGLLLPFIISLLVLRFVVDRLVRANLEMSETANFVGGSLTGAVAGAITMGICVIGIGHMRTGEAVFGFKPIADERGNMRYASPLLIPVDMAVVKLYEGMSVGSFSTKTPLAEYRPDAHIMAGLSRMTFEGSTRPTVDPKEVELLGTYTITGRLDDLLSDQFNPGVPQAPLKLDGETYNEGDELRGFVLQLNAGAKEKSGNVILTSAQVQLTVDNDGKLERLLPIALIERTGGGTVALARFRFDAEGTTATSVGGSDKAVFAFEFLVNPNAKIRNIFVKGARIDASKAPTASFASADQRDDAILDGSSVFAHLGGSSLGDVDTSQSQTLASAAGSNFESVRRSSTLPYGMRLLVSAARSQLKLSEDNLIQSGTGKFGETNKATTGTDSKLMVDKFFIPRGTKIIQVEVAREGRKSIFGRALDAAEKVVQPILVDQNGTTFLPIGYILAEGTSYTISFDPAKPIRALAEIPALSSTRSQSLTLLFSPDLGTTLTGFLLGNKEVANFGEDGFEVR